MRDIKRLGVCALAVCVLGAVGAGSASATEYPPTGVPEIGRCVSNPGKGGFKGLKPRCIVHSPTHTGNWEWLPGPGTNGKIIERVGSPTFETTGGKKIGCSYIFLNGELTGSKTAKFTELTLQGCGVVGQGLACFSNQAEPGTIEGTNALVGELGFIPGSPNPANPWVGWDVKPESEVSATIVEFFCGEGTKALPAETVKLEGSVIARVKSLNKMVEIKSFPLYYKQEKGIQKPTMFIGGVEDVLTQVTTPTLNPLEAKTEQVGLSATAGELETGEIMEIKQKQK